MYALSPRRSTALRWSRHITRVYRLPFEILHGSGPELAKRIDDVATRVGADVVFPIDETPIRAVSAAADQLTTATVSLPRPDVFDICNDKHAFAQFCDSHDLPQPASWRMVTSADDLPPDLNYPVIAKPPLGGGGIGVVRVDTPAALADHLRSGVTGSAPPILVQDFIPGTDIDCSFLAESGTLVASAVQTRASMHDRTVQFLDRPDVEAICADLARALDYDGLAHVDLRLDERDGSIRIIETNPRVWGSIAYAMQAGINFPALAVDRAMGQARSGEAPRVDPVAVTNTPVSPSMLARSVLRRGAPAGLSGPDAAAWEANAADPLPSLAIHLRHLVNRVQSRLRPGHRTA